MEELFLNDIMPVVALRGLVVFPESNLHFEVGRQKSIEALEWAMNNSRLVFLVAQKEVATEEPKLKDLYKIGVVASVRQVMRMPNSDNIRVTVEGLYRAEITEMVKEKPYLKAAVKRRNDVRIKENDFDYVQALMRRVKDEFEDYARVAPRLAPDILLRVIDEKDPSKLADFIAGNIMIEYDRRYHILSALNVIDRLIRVCVMLENECELLVIEENIQDKVQEQIDKNQREYYLREQLSVISKELNDGVDYEEEILEYRDKISALPIKDEHRQKLLRECSRLEKMSPTSPEATVTRTYLDTLLNMPWGIYTEDDLDLERAAKILDEDHYGLEKVKTRIIEMLAVRKLNPEITGQIICLAGPPGVGKTSIARSVAKAMGRKYRRVSLGGVHDEAEIRGHRKTYIGSMPGRIMATVESAGSANPLILLDEIDKLGSDYKGDPSSALLEVLDPEQNNTFCDHYLEVPFDLSRVLFITTANNIENIPAPLLDRMEIIELGSYTAEEKFHIAKNHLIPKQRKNHGLNGNMIRFSDDAVRKIISAYTREAGVRKLERQINAVCRKAAVKYDSTGKCFTVKEQNLEEILGAEKYKGDHISGENVSGVVNGLAWTAVGGEILQVEALVMEGTGKLELTGSLGDVMKESAKAALSFIRSRAEHYKTSPDFYKTKDIHIHVPEGAVPKDGPSAGVTISTALLSALTGKKVRSSVAMTGEISLTGRVLPIGGLKEKTMAAYKAGIKTVIIPADNVCDLQDVADTVKENIKFISVNSLEEVFSVALICEDEEKNKKSNIISKKPEQGISAITQ